MLNFVDSFLNKITMYRLVLYVLILFFVAAVALSTVGLLPYNPLDFILSAAVIISVCFITNKIFAYVFRATVNVESAYITALILICIISPAQFGDYGQFFSLAIWAAVWSMASKFILAIRKKHLFNPAAFAVVLTWLALGQSASWWIGTAYMLPFVLVGGTLIVRKTRRSDMVIAFLLSAVITSVFGFWLVRGTDPLLSLRRTVIDSALFFFASVMLTEPLTTPPTRGLRTIYGVLVGFLFSPVVHLGSVYSTPELALVIGNVFSYIVSPKEKLILKLKEVVTLAKDTYEFVFTKDRSFTFVPGQYLEWTLAHQPSDSRGNRRYFTIASAPTEEEIKIGVKFYEPASSFKQKMRIMVPGDTIVAAQRAGDFVMPKDKSEKLVFIAGGIGVTPFRSMIQYLLDTNERRTITMLYSNKTSTDVAYKETFDRAEKVLGVKTVYAITNPAEGLSWSSARSGIVDAAMIEVEVPDFKERTFYLSGPHAMVTTFEKLLKEMGVPLRRIKTDYFPGFA